MKGTKGCGALSLENRVGQNTIISGIFRIIVHRAFEEEGQAQTDTRRNTTSSRYLALRLPPSKRKERKKEGKKGFGGTTCNS